MRVMSKKAAFGMGLFIVLAFGVTLWVFVSLTGDTEFAVRAAALTGGVIALVCIAIVWRRMKLVHESHQ